MSKDNLGDRQKEYEGKESDRRFIPMLPVCARLDGRGFSRFTKGLQRPYDVGMSQLMQSTAEYLIKNTGATISYTQSDEISLIWRWDEYDKHSVFFDGRIQKMTSMLASMASVEFNSNKVQHLPIAWMKKVGLFDCRVWQVPNLEEAANVLLWRELDASRNSVSMAAQHFFSHNELQGMKCEDMKIKLLNDKAIDWEQYPTFFKRGTYFKRVTTKNKLTPEELADLPPKHNARKNPDMEFERSYVTKVEFSPLHMVKNKVDILFN